MDTRTPLHSGGCQCGSIRYSVFAPPCQPVIICHCRMCQKAMGSSSGIFIAVNLTDFQWTRGTVTAFESSSNARRLFCGQCGTPLAFQSKQNPMIDFCLGTFDHPKELGQPLKQIGVESCVGEWALLPNIDTEKTDPAAEETMASYQHPDKETNEAEWLEISKNKSTKKK